MTNWLKALVFCTALQILTSVGAIAYLQVHSNGMAREYSLLAEQNARRYSDDSIMVLYNRVQKDMEIERIQTTAAISRAIELNNARSQLQGK